MEKYLKALSNLREILWPVKNLMRMVVSLIQIKLRPITSENLEIGSGPKQREGWVTLDMCSGTDVYWDLRFELPFKESSFDRIYCSHVLEHFSYKELIFLLRNIFNVLKPGGQFLICVPDASLYVDAYLGKLDPESLMQYKPAISSSKSMDILNYIFYMDGHHKFMFDAESLSYHCQAAGFSSCEPRIFDSTLDMAVRDYESLYMLCLKK